MTEYGSGGSYAVQMDGPYAGSGVANTVIATISALADDWKGGASPYSQDVTVDGISINSKIDIQMDAEQLALFSTKYISFFAVNNGGTVTVYAIGDKPDKDLEFQATLTPVVKISGDDSVILGNVISTDMPNADYSQTNTARANFIKNKPDEQIETALTTAENALPKSGGTMTGAIDMNGKRLYNLPTPTDDKDACPKDYADYIAAIANSALATAVIMIPKSKKGAANGVASLNSEGKLTASEASSTVKTVGADYVFTPADAGKLIRVYGIEADCSFTLPSADDDDFAIGDEIEVCRYTPYNVTIKAPSDRYILYPECATNSMGGSLKIGHRYGCVALKRVAGSAWLASGDIE